MRGRMPRKETRRLLAYLAANVRRTRESRAFTQEGLADRADLALRYLQRIERGAVNPSVGVLAALATALNVAPGDLLQRATPLPPPRRGRPRRQARRL